MGEVASGGTISAARLAIIAAERCATASAITFLFTYFESSYYWFSSPDTDGLFVG